VKEEKWKYNFYKNNVILFMKCP